MRRGRGEEQQGDWRMENIGWDEGAKAVNLGVRQTDGEAKTDECKEFWGNQEGQRGGLLCAEWNRVVRTRGRNVRGQEDCWIWTWTLNHPKPLIS